MSNNKKFIIHLFFKKRSKCQIIRPVLKLNRKEIFILCDFWLLPIYVDLSNQSIDFRRNRIRHQILPILRIFFNKKIDYILNKHIEIINNENFYFIDLQNKIKRFIQVKNTKLETTKQIDLGWIYYLPNSLKFMAYNYFLKFLFQQLNFDEIKYLLKE